MDWSQLFTSDETPTLHDMDVFIRNPLWADVNAYLRQAYAAAPKVSYSGCAGQPGWNVKYQKRGKSLCTLYPMPGFFIALVVIGPKEMINAELCSQCAALTRRLCLHKPLSACPASG